MRSVFLVLSVLALSFSLSACQEPEKPRVKEPLPMSVVTFPSRTVLVLPRQGPYGKIDRAIEEMRTYLTKKNITPAGPFMGVFFDNPDEVPPEKMRYEVQVPVTNLTDAPAPFLVRVTKRRMTAAVSLRGPYDRIIRRYAEAYEWVEKHGYEVAGPLIEVYVVPPGPNVPPAGVRTEVHIPVKPAGP